jgi:hypothetical protein
MVDCFILRLYQKPNLAFLSFPKFVVGDLLNRKKDSGQKISGMTGEIVDSAFAGMTPLIKKYKITFSNV